MKLMYFGFTCLCSGMLAGNITHEPSMGFFASLSLWWLLLSLDSIVNKPAPDAKPLAAIGGNCEDEL